MTKNRISFFMMWFLIVFLIAGRVWKPNKNPISWDTAGYYLYLPATFIYKDIRLKDYNRVDSLRNKYGFSDTFYQIYKSPKDGYYIKYTMGSAFLYSPFFAAGHVMAKLTGAPADGFSRPYQNAMLIGCLLYAFLSILMMRKILLHFFSDKVTAFTMLCIVAGTNLYFILSMDNLQIHAVLFLLYSCLIWQSIRFHSKPGYLNAALMGLFAGLIILTRPTDIVSWLIPIFWGVNSPSVLWEKIKSNFSYFLVFGIIAAGCFFPQMFYWKLSAGEWFFNSYNNAGEGLDLKSPHTIPFLFSYRKGWLVYTPMAIFCILGIFFARKKKPALFFPLLVYFLLNLWLISSWTCWWYAGSFSSRAMVQSYAIMMIPLGFFIQWVFGQKKIIAITGRVILLLVVFLCGFQTWQYAEGILKMDGMTKKFYWKSFCQTKQNPGNNKYLLRERYLTTDTIQTGEMFNIKFEKSWTDSLMLDSATIFSTLYEDEYGLIAEKYFTFIRVEGMILNMDSTNNNPVDLVRHMAYKGKLYGYNAKNISLGGNTWKPFKIDYILPEVRCHMDRVKVYFWLRGKARVYIKHLKLSVLEPASFPELE